MRKGARLINCARGGIYDEAALVEGLKSGHLGGVALDVYTTEPCTNSPLFGMPNVLCTPHLGASTEEAQTQVAVEGVNLLVDFLTTGTIRHAVNFTPIDSQDAGRSARLSGRGLSAGFAAGPVRDHLDPALHAELSGRSGRQEHPADHRRLCRRPAGQRPGRSDQHRQRRSAAPRTRHRTGRTDARTDLGAFSSMVAAEVVTETHVHQAAAHDRSDSTCCGWCSSTNIRSTPIWTAC